MLHVSQKLPNLRVSPGWVLFWFLASFCLCSSLGCRSFVQAKSNSQLVAARELSRRGADAMQRSRPQDAEMLFSEALRNSTLDERAHWGFANSLWQRGEKQRAIEHMREALRLSGKNPEYAVRLGEMNLEVGNRGAARELALGVLSVNHKHAEAWALLGDTHQAERDWPAAEECYNRALLEKSDFPRVQLSIAEIYLRTGRPRGTLRILDRMADLHATSSNDPDVLLMRGVTLADLGREAAAAEALAMASERMPSDRIEKQIQLVTAQHRIGELVPARITLGKLIASNTNNPEVKRLQSMLDMSFAHLSDPTAPSVRDPNLLANHGVDKQNLLQNGASNFGKPNATLIASPTLNGSSGMLNGSTGDLLRR
jgi:tetratricopeptide (TPR) repeat protein